MTEQEFFYSGFLTPDSVLDGLLASESSHS